MPENVVKLQGFIKTVTPLVQMPPQGGGSRGRTYMSRLNIIRDPSEVQAESEKDDGERVRFVSRVPIYTANGLVGLFRRLTAKNIFDSLLEKGHKVPLHIADWMRTGAGRSADSFVSGDEDPEKQEMDFSEHFKGIRPEAITEYGQNVNIHSGVFGGGIFMEGRLQLMDLIPAVEETRPVLNEFALDEALPKATEIYSVRPWVRKADLLESNPELKWFDDQELQRYYAAVYKEAEDRKQKQSKGEETSGHKLSTRHIGEVEHIVPNTRMAFSMTLVDPVPAQVGMMVRAFEELAEFPYLGGKQRWGFGQIEANVAKKGSADRIVITEPGSCDIEGFDEELVAYDDWLAEISVNDLDILAYFKGKR